MTARRQRGKRRGYQTSNARAFLTLAEARRLTSWVQVLQRDNGALIQLAATQRSELDALRRSAKPAKIAKPETAATDTPPTEASAKLHAGKTSARSRSKERRK